MIRANELRLGNWVHGYCCTFQVAAITRDGFVEPIDPEEGQFSMFDLEGVELTEDILLKCPKFAKVYFDELEYIDYQGSGIYDIYTGDKNGFLEVVISLDDRELKRITVLHELQNWIFLLTGEELTINL